MTSSEKTDPPPPASAPIATVEPLPRAREPLLLSLGCNIALPMLLLTKGGRWFSFLPPWAVLVVALAFPVGYFLYDFKKRGKANFFSILGMVSVVLTGGIGLLKLSPAVFAWKETAIPLILGAFTVLSLRFKRPLVAMFLLNPELINVAKLDAAIDTPSRREGFQRLMVQSTWIFAASFIVSAALNFIFATSIVTTDPRGGPAAEIAFNEEIGKMTGLSWIVITLATLPLSIWALFHLFRGLKALTGLSLEELAHEPPKKS